MGFKKQLSISNWYIGSNHPIINHFLIQTSSIIMDNMENPKQLSTDQSHTSTPSDGIKGRNGCANAILMSRSLPPSPCSLTYLQRHALCAGARSARSRPAALWACILVNGSIPEAWAILGAGPSIKIWVSSWCPSWSLLGQKSNHSSDPHTSSWVNHRLKWPDNLKDPTGFLQPGSMINYYRFLQISRRPRLWLSAAEVG